MMYDIGLGKVGFAAKIKDKCAWVLISHLKEQHEVGASVSVKDTTDFSLPTTVLNFHNVESIEVMIRTLQIAKELLEGANGNQEPV
jgi:hypothetical protein